MKAAVYESLKELETMDSFKGIGITEIDRF